MEKVAKKSDGVETPTKCSVGEGACGKPVLAKGLCAAHYTRLRTKGDTGSPETAPRRPNGAPKPKCAVEKCPRVAYAKGYCEPHLRRARKYGVVGPPDIEDRIAASERGDRCAVDGCLNKRRRGQYCASHGHRLARYGDPLAPHRKRPNGTGRIHRGYVRVYAPGHANANATGQILEHRLVMSQILGRPLSGGENVHHRDGDRGNNTIGPCYARRECDCPENPRHNLELWLTAQPPGQHVADHISASVALIARCPEMLTDEQRETLRHAADSKASSERPA